MPWIVFDDQTRNALSEMPGAPAMELASGEPLVYALSSPRDCVVVLPAQKSGEVLLLTLKRNRQPEAATLTSAKPKKAAEPSIHYVAGGFLGLSDEVALDETPEERQSWWKRLFH